MQRTKEYTISYGVTNSSCVKRIEEKTKTTKAELKPMLDALSLRITKPFPIPIYNRLSGFSKCFPWVRLLVNAVAVKIKQKTKEKYYPSFSGLVW